MASLDEFSKRISTVAIKVQAGCEKTVRKAALAADAAVVLATPVDTGRARSNWLVELDVAAIGTIPPYVPGSGLGVGETENASRAMEQGAGVIAKYKADKNREIHITNNLPYIQRLNEGSSQQAPENFVEQAVAAGVRSVQGARVLSNGGL